MSVAAIAQCPRCQILLRRPVGSGWQSVGGCLPTRAGL